MVACQDARTKTTGSTGIDQAIAEDATKSLLADSPKVTIDSTGIDQPVVENVTKSLSADSPNRIRSCINIMTLSSDTDNWFSKTDNLKYAAAYMAQEDPIALGECLAARLEARSFHYQKHARAASIFSDAYDEVKPQLSSIWIIEAAREDYIDTYYISKLAIEGQASEKAIKQALAIIKKKEPQVYENLVENFKENGVLK